MIESFEMSKEGRLAGKHRGGRRTVFRSSVDHLQRAQPQFSRWTDKI